MTTNATDRNFVILEGYEKTAVMPRRATKKSAGYDLHWTGFVKDNEEFSGDEINLQAGDRIILETGLTVRMEDDDELQVRPRSGNAFNHGITVLNSPGTVDADYYPKQIKVLLINHGYIPFNIKKGDRIAQGVFGKYLTVTDDNPIEEDRKGGFGSTGR